MTAAVAVKAAMTSESLAALSKASSRNNSPYHLKEKPVQDVIIDESLNEKTIRHRIGTYKKAKPTPNTTARRTGSGRVMPNSSGVVQLLDLVVLEQDQRNQQHQNHDAGHCRRHRPIGVTEELCPHHPPHHQGIGATQHLGYDVFANRRNEHQHGSGDHTGHGQGDSNRQKGLPGPRAQVVGGFQQTQIKLDQVGVQGQHKERQVGIDQAYVDSEIGAINFQRHVYGAQPQQEVIEQAIVAQDPDPGIHTQQQGCPKRQDDTQQQQVAQRRFGSGDVIRHRIADQHAAQRGDRCHLHRVQVCSDIQAIAEQQRVATQAQGQCQGLLLQFRQRGIRRNAETQIGKADLQYQQKRQQQKQGQPQERRHDRQPAPNRPSAPRKSVHDGNTVALSSDHDTNTSSSRPGASAWASSKLGTLASISWPESSLTW